MENAEKFVISRVPRIERLLEILKLVDTCKGGGSSEKDGTRKLLSKDVSKHYQNQEISNF